MLGLNLLPSKCHPVLKDEKVEKEGKRVPDQKVLPEKLEGLWMRVGLWAAVESEQGLARDEWDKPAQEMTRDNKRRQDETPTGVT